MTDVINMWSLFSGFLTDDLTIHDDTVDGSGKYLGVCKLPGEERKVRIDVCMYVCMYVCIYACVYVCMYVHVCMYVCM